MVDQPETDIVMKFTLHRLPLLVPVLAECQLDIGDTDPLMIDFISAHNVGGAGEMSVDSFPNFFEVTKFDFGLALKESDQHGQKNKEGAFARFRSMTESEFSSLNYPVELDKFSLEKTIDMASPILFQCCCNSVTLESAAIVKRVSRGDDRQPWGYVRADFSHVLITSIKWEDGDVMKESIEFIARSMEISYRVRRANGQVMPWPVGLDPFKAQWPKPKSSGKLLDQLNPGKRAAAFAKQAKGDVAKLKATGGRLAKGAEGFARNFSSAAKGRFG